MRFPDLQHPSIALYYLFYALMLGVAGWKLYRRHKGDTGGEPELYAVFVYFFTFVLAGVLYSDNPPVFSGVDFTALLADLILAIGLFAIALNANRIWPLVAAAAQFVGLFSHFSRAMQISIEPMAYSLLRTLPVGVVLLCVLIGFFSHFQRYRQYGYDYDWIDWTRIRGLGSPRG